MKILLEVVEEQGAADSSLGGAPPVTESSLAMPKYSRISSPEGGVALILVMFVVALATIIVVELAYSSYIGGRLNRGAERSLQAEYLLKSALNLSRVLLKVDPTDEDSGIDPWALFKDGAPIPVELLGISEPNLQISLEIRPENAKLNLRNLRQTIAVNTKQRDIFHRLFQELGFDADGELDHTGLTQEREFDAARLVANLIDYMDDDKESYDEGPFQGIESSLRPEDEFPNREIVRLEELGNIPGFTPLRVQQLLPFVTTNRASLQVNANMAPREVLLVLDPSLSTAQVDDIVAFREGPDGPITSVSQQLSNIVGNQSDLFPLLTEKGDVYQVIAKVDYDTSVYFLRAFIRRSGSGPGANLPRIESIELF